MWSNLKYGTNVLTMHRGPIKPGQRVLITDDLFTTGTSDSKQQSIPLKN